MNKELIEAAKAVIAFWEKYLASIPYNKVAEDAEFEEFLNLRSAIDRAEQQIP